jgi:hypothetical protein
MFINLGFYKDVLTLATGPHAYKKEVGPEEFETELKQFETTSISARRAWIDDDTEPGLSMLRLMDAGFCSIGDNDILARLPDKLIDDWKTIIAHVIKRTLPEDEDFGQFLNRHLVSLGEKNKHDEQQAEEASKRIKAAATKALKKPGPKHKLAAYKRALKNFGGKPEPGDEEVAAAFYKKVIYYADDERERDDDIDEVPVDWNVTWKTARNQIRALLKE